MGEIGAMCKGAHDTASTGRLTLVATPIGNLGDITLRALEALRAADVVYAEDTRMTGKLLHALGIEGKRLERLDENVIGSRAPEVCARIAAGEHAAYCTDAGMPGVSDPGLRLVAAARAAGVPVEVLPGASAAATAYVTSGTTSSTYYFGGFFPRKRGQQTTMLNQLRDLDAALVFYESPRRVVAALEAIAEAFPNREVAVCRELTKLHEEVERAGAPELARTFKERDARSPIKGEIAIVIDAPSKCEAASNMSQSREKAHDAAKTLAEGGMRPKAIVSELVARFGISRNDAYEIALAAKHAAESADADAAESACVARDAAGQEGKTFDERDS